MNTNYLLLANIIILSGIGVYALFLGMNQKTLERRILKFELEKEENDGSK